MRALILTLAFSTYAFAANYYVSASGSGTTCSMGSPCTLDYIGGSGNPKSLAGGDTVYLLSAGGPFEGSFLWRVSGSVGNPIVLDGLSSAQIDNVNNDTAIYGSELLTNGALTSGTGWTATGDFALAANAATYTHSTGTGTLSRAITISPTALFRLQYTVSADSGTAPACTFPAAFAFDDIATGDPEVLPSTDGTHNVYFWATATPTTFQINCTSSGAGAFTIDDLSVKLRNPNAAINFFLASNVRLQNTEIFNSSGERDFSSYTDPATLGCYPSCFSDGVGIYGQNIQLWNLKIHDVGQCVVAQNASEGLDVQETFCYYPGWIQDNRGTGHGFYIQNSCAGNKTFGRLTVWWTMAYGFQMTGGAGSNVSCISLLDSTIFASALLGPLAAVNQQGGPIIQGGNPTTKDNLVVSRVRMWNECNSGSRWGAYTPGYQNGLTSATITDNYLKSPPGNRAGTITSLTYSGNSWYGDSNEASQTLFSGDTFGACDADTTDRLYEVPWVIDATHGTLTVFNNDGNTTASYTPACPSGTVALRPIMAYTGAAQHTFDCDGMPHTITMNTTVTPIAPLGAVGNAPVETGSTFNVYYLTYAGGGTPVQIETTSLPNGTDNVAYSETLSATGGTAPYTWAVTVGTLPTGLSLDTMTGAITGTPTTPGTSNFTVQVTDDVSATDTQALSITIDAAPDPVMVSTTTLDACPAGTAYSEQLQYSGGLAPVTWTVTVGALPSGLTLSATGLISGTCPTAVGTTTFTVQVEDADMDTDTQELSITVTPSVSPDEIICVSRGAGKKIVIQCRAKGVPITQPITLDVFDSLNTVVQTVTIYGPSTRYGIIGVFQDDFELDGTYTVTITAGETTTNIEVVTGTLSGTGTLNFNLYVPQGRSITNVLIEYGTTSALGSSVNLACTTTCNPTVTGLTRDTVYYYRVVWRDASNNTVAQSVINALVAQ